MAYLVQFLASRVVCQPVNGVLGVDQVDYVRQARSYAFVIFRPAAAIVRFPTRVPPARGLSLILAISVFYFWCVGAVVHILVSRAAGCSYFFLCFPVDIGFRTVEDDGDYIDGLCHFVPVPRRHHLVHGEARRGMGNNRV